MGLPPLPYKQLLQSQKPGVKPMAATAICTVLVIAILEHVLSGWHVVLAYLAGAAVAAELTYRWCDLSRSSSIWVGALYLLVRVSIAGLFAMAAA